MTFGSLFAGIGGLDLGFERAGFECRWQVEIDDYARRVLAKHWPNVRRWDDVRTFMRECSAERIDCVVGGFPCQDISSANPNRTGIRGKRSGLWSEFKRIVRTMGPRIVVVENVPNLAVLGLDRVLGDLADLGFDAEWAIVPASLCGAPQPRRRMFIVAYPMCERWPVLLRGEPGTFTEAAPWGEWQSCAPGSRCDVLQAVEQRVGEPSVLACGDGISNRLESLTAIGNAVVPQVAEYIARRILAAASEVTNP